MNLLDLFLLIIVLEILGPKNIQDPLFCPTYYCDISRVIRPIGVILASKAAQSYHFSDLLPTSD